MMEALDMIERTAPLGPAIKHSLGFALLSIIEAAERRIASGENLREHEIAARITAEGLIMLAYVHSGDEESFIEMARRAIAAVNYGTEH